MSDLKIHERFMLEALKEAEKAYRKKEVPIGAVIVSDNRIIGRGHNHPIGKCDPTAHAEVTALRRAAKKMRNYRMNDTTMYVTVEPCPMCAGALVNARVKEVILGCRDSKSGACGSVMNVVNNGGLNHRVKVMRGVLEKPCRNLIQKFFCKKRLKK
jgi:tRNA(adenine34) deaminase